MLLLLACTDAPVLEDTAPEAAPATAWVELADLGTHYEPTCHWEPEVPGQVSWYLDDSWQEELDPADISCETQVRCLVENALGGASSEPVRPEQSFDIVLRAVPRDEAWLCEVECGPEGLYRFAWDERPGPLLWPGEGGLHTCTAEGPLSASLELELPGGEPIAELRLVAGEAGERLGHAVSSADLDGDGAMDLLLGAPNRDAGEDWAGALYVVPGASLSRSEIQLEAPGLLGLGRANYLGWSLAGVADRDGDGLGEVLIGAPGQDDRATLGGAVYLVDGDELDSDLRQVEGWQAETERLWFGVDVDASADGLVAGGYGYQDDRGAAWLLAESGLIPEPSLEGEVAEGYLGLSVAWAGDTDGDGLPEWAAGAPFADRVVLVEGDETQLLEGPAGGLYGWDLAGVGDFDGDGVDELLIAAPGAGQAWTSTGLWLDVDAEVVAAAGDVDGDGRAELLLGEPGRDRAFLVFADGTQLRFTGPDSFGRGLASVPDQDGDGLPELLLGAPESQDQAGEVWLLLGPFEDDRSL